MSLSLILAADQKQGGTEQGQASMACSSELSTNGTFALAPASLHHRAHTASKLQQTASDAPTQNSDSCLCILAPLQAVIHISNTFPLTLLAEYTSEFLSILYIL